MITLHSFLSKPLGRLLGALIVSSIACSSITDASVIDSNSHPVWTTSKTTGNGTFASEADGGSLVLGISNSTNAGTNLKSTSLSDDLNFTKAGKGLKVTVTGIALTGNIDGTSQKLRLSLTDDPLNQPYGAGLSAFTVAIRGNNRIDFGYKTTVDTKWGEEGGTTGDHGERLVSQTGLAGAVTGFTLTLSPNTYHLAVTTSAGGDPLVVSGDFTLSSEWDDLAFSVFLQKDTASSGSVTATMANINLQVIPEPSQTALLGAGLIGAFNAFRRRRS